MFQFYDKKISAIKKIINSVNESENRESGM